MTRSWAVRARSRSAVARNLIFFVVHVVYSCLKLSGVNSEQIRRGEEDDEGAELAEDRVAALYG